MDFFQSELREHQVRPSALPGESFGFVERQLHETRLLKAERLELSLDSRAGSRKVTIGEPEPGRATAGFRFNRIKQQRWR